MFANVSLREAMPAICIFRNDYLTEQRAIGRKVNPCSRAGWDEVKHAWNALPAPSRQLYEDRADASRALAAQARRDRRAAQHARRQLALDSQAPLAPAQEGELALVAASQEENHAREQPLSLNACLRGENDALLTQAAPCCTALASTSSAGEDTRPLAPGLVQQFVHGGAGVAWLASSEG